MFPSIFSFLLVVSRLHLFAKLKDGDTGKMCRAWALWTDSSLSAPGINWPGKNAQHPKDSALCSWSPT